MYVAVRACRPSPVQAQSCGLRAVLHAIQCLHKGVPTKTSYSNFSFCAMTTRW